MWFGVFVVDIELQSNKLEVAGVRGEGTLEVCVQYLRRSTFLGERPHDEFDDHGRRIFDPETVTTGRGLSDRHATGE